MKIKNLENCPKYKLLFDQDEFDRKIHLYRLYDVVVTGKNLYYPNTLLFSQNSSEVFKPISEKVMSLQNVEQDNDFTFELQLNYHHFETPVFFFIYNTENYYHFIYDTLPYLISFFELKKEIHNLKLLMNLPNKDKKEFYPFVLETLNILGITGDDIMIVDNSLIYKNIYISSSYTHNIDSNLPPRKEIKDLFSRMCDLVEDNKDLPKKIYISRRSWKHNDFSNIGTNYTTRRKMINEDDLVESLIDQGYEEIFTEKLSMVEKIQLFKNAEKIIGSIGGGLVNVVFSKSTTKLLTIVSPYFLEINKRFQYSLDFASNILFYKTKHLDDGNFKKYSRVMCGEIIGEIVDKKDNQIKIIYDDVSVSGWDLSRNFEEKWMDSNYCKSLDNGLNSEYIVDLDAFNKIVKEKLC